VASWKQQALIEAPVETVWEILVDPSRSPEWDEDVIEVTGAPVEIQVGSTFGVTARGRLGLKESTTFKVEELEDMHALKMKCQRSGYYVHWLLTPARGNTFTELELGVEPLPGLSGRAMAAMVTKGYLRRTVEKTIEALGQAIGPDRAKAP
jgi:uncharacterized protein YndB with AHSA1/START domain